VRSRSSSAPRHRHLAGTNNPRRRSARVRYNTAKNSREQFSLIQPSVQEQTPVAPVTTLSPPLEISYSPVSDLFPDIFDDLFPFSPPPAPHSVLPSPIEKFSVSYITPLIPYIQTDAYTPPGHLPLLFHNAHQLLEYMSYFTPCTNDQVIVCIAGSSCLFSILIKSLIPIDSLSFQSYDLIQL